MVGSLPVSLIVGAILGFLTGLGTGGGSLLVLWLTLVLGMDSVSARTVNLMFFLPAALIATLLRLRKRCIPWKKIILPIIAGSASAGLFAMIGSHLDTSVLEKPFGLLLIVMGLRELFYRPRKPK
jgi:uncharacterized membrane protein YfcA